MVSLSNPAVEAFKTLETLFERLERAGFSCECDGYSLALDLPDERHYLLNYHGVTNQIWLASPLTGAHHFQLQDNRWVSTRGTDDLMALLEKELVVSLS